MALIGNQMETEIDSNILPNANACSGIARMSRGCRATNRPVWSGYLLVFPYDVELKF
jgi:hypothetical protein